MIVTRTSKITGQEHSLDLDITFEQLFRVSIGLELIQNIVPHLSPSDREFLITGITSEEWNDLFGDDDN